MNQDDTVLKSIGAFLGHLEQLYVLSNDFNVWSTKNTKNLVTDVQKTPDNLLWEIILTLCKNAGQPSRL